MTRLDAELHRLYLPTTVPPGLSDGVVAHDTPLISADGQVRALVLGLARPADWDGLAKAWQGVQTDLGWPAPAIAVSGTDGHQLWFSLAAPVPLAQAAACVVALQQRYLGGVKPERVLCWPPESAWPSVPDHPRGGGGAVAHLPGQPVRPNQWSAWVTPDLARIFEDEPWLDLPPGRDAQADVLCRLKAIPLADFQQALGQTQHSAGATPVTPHAADAPRLPAQGQLGPRQFLRQVMNDPAVDMQWRIAAASALLPHASDMAED